MKQDLPTIIHEIGFDFNWRNQKVWALDVPAEEIPISELSWLLEHPFIWPIPAGYDKVTPHEVMRDPHKYPGEYERMQQADTKYPIDIMFWKNRWLILDGIHRLMKLSLEGAKTIQVRKIPQSAIPLIRDDSPDNAHSIPPETRKHFDKQAPDTGQ